jgi:DNA-binding transcriptional ArsR family regulator
LCLTGSSAAPAAPRPGVSAAAQPWARAAHAGPARAPAHLIEPDHPTAHHTAITCLADYLDSCGSPIDYQRRRNLIPAETITTCKWRDLCFSVAAHPGEGRRHRDAQRYLFQLLTGADLHDPGHALAFTSTSDYSHYHAFAGTLSTGLRDALHAHAAGFLHDLGIGEPLNWSPPPGCCTGLELPGPEPDDIDLDAVGRLIVTDGLPAAEAAARLGTTEGLRLRRFQTAMTSPTIAAAATRLRICPSALSHQLRRLERDIGARLYQPATSRRPWRPTRRGAALLTALARPGIQALAAAHAPDVSGPAGSRSRYRDRMPISLGPDAAPARQAASLFRVLANPTRLAILLTLQTGDQRITDLAAQLGGSQANISAHLIKLKKSGLITSRTQGRAVYYRLTRPELGTLLQAAGQLLATDGHQAPQGPARQA